MDPAEVIKQSTYAADFSIRGPFDDRSFNYGSPIVTANVDFEVLAPHRVRVDDLLYWDIMTEFDAVTGFSADAPFLTLDAALGRAKRWDTDIGKAGWVRISAFYSMPERIQYNDWNDLRKAFLLRGKQKVIGATIGRWLSADGNQVLIVGLEHKREDGGPRGPNTPDPAELLNDKTYFLRFSVMYAEPVEKYRVAHQFELRQDALKRKHIVRQ